VITGGSAGLGAAFADRLAGRGHDLLLVARDAERLAVTAREIATRHGVRVDVLATDLAQRHGLFRLEALLSGPEGLAVDVLVNNAAVESGSPFPEADLAAVQAEIDLNVTATMRLTHAVLPGMLQRGEGTVVNVGSVAGWLPSAGSTYGPTKAWVAAFTDSLAPVLRDTGVRTLALCPGFVRTGWHGTAAPEGRLSSVLWSDPGPVVDTCLADLDRGRTLSVPGAVHRPVVGMLELPRRTLRAMARVAGASREARWARAAHAPVPARTPAAPPTRPVAPAAQVADGPADRPRLPDLPAGPAGRSGTGITPARPHAGRSPHFVHTARLTGEARARADRARSRPGV
jgi:short-subunit dehydrogenase